jgi:hypothetical protein
VSFGFLSVDEASSTMTSALPNALSGPTFRKDYFNISVRHQLLLSSAFLVCLITMAFIPGRISPVILNETAHERH